jgi:hypothetical protein
MPCSVAQICVEMAGAVNEGRLFFLDAKAEFCNA